MTQHDIEMMKSLGIIPLEDDKDTQIEQVRNDKALISNELIEAIYHSSNTLTAFKILFYIARIDTSNSVLKEDYFNIRINIKEFEKYSGLNKKILDRNLKDIQQTTVTFYSKKNKQFFTRYSLISKCEYLDDDITMEIDMHKEIHSRINSHIDFTPIDTPNIMKIEHKHSPKMIMLLTQISRFSTEHKYKRYTLKQLNYLFDVNYENFYMFEKKILKPIKKELDNNSSVSFDYVKVKDKLYVGKGRKPIKEIKIIPKIKTYIETDIFSNLNYEQADTPADAQTKEQKEIQRLRKIEELEQQIDKELIFLKFGATSTEQKREIYLKIVEFINYVLDNNKDYKDLTESFFRYYKIAVKNGWSF